jgi:hypothetical protein
MLAAVDLHQLPETRASRPRLVDLRRALAARHPQAGVRHQVPHGLLCEPDTMTFPQLLARQRRPEIGIALADDRERAQCQTFVKLPVTGITSLARRQSGRARLSVARHQPLDLTYRQAETLRGPARLESHLDDRLNHLQSVQFAHVQAHQCGWVHGWLPAILHESPACQHSETRHF